MSIFNLSRNVSPQASGRIQHCSLKLSMYQYVLQFCPTAQHGNGDALSRLPLPDTLDTVPFPGKLILHNDYLADEPITATQLKLVRLNILFWQKYFTLSEWLAKYHGWFRFETKWWELTELDGCITWCSWVLIPSEACEHILAELHGGHPDGARMKSLACTFIWWPGMDHQIEETVLAQNVNRLNQFHLLLHCVHGSGPPSHGHSYTFWFHWTNEQSKFFVIVNAHSKQIEVFKMNSATAAATIEVLRTIFALYGLPESIVSNNCPQFWSSEFAQFCHTNGICYVRVLPYHPSLNSLAEHAVQMFKNGFKKVQCIRKYSIRKIWLFSFLLPRYSSNHNWYVTCRIADG